MKKNLALAAIALVLLLGAAQSPNSVPDQLKAIQAGISDLKAQNDSLAAQVASNGSRKFYLTKTTHNGAQALSACAAGYHMASQWEILDPSNFRYDTVLGFTMADSGFGPPATFGWIRTGGIAEVTSPTSSNCNAWMSASLGDLGTLVRLPLSLNSPSVSKVDPWEASFTNCGEHWPVWCVQD